MSKIPDVLILVALLLTGVAIGYAARLGRADSDKPVEPHTTVEVQLMLLFPSTTPDDRLKLKHALGAPAVGKLFGKFDNRLFGDGEGGRLRFVIEGKGNQRMFFVRREGKAGGGEPGPQAGA